MMKRKEISQESFRGMMKLAVGAAMFAAMAFTSKVDAQQIQVNPTGKGTPKYVFLFIGDGMSYPQIQSSAYYLGKDAAGIVDTVKKSENPKDSPYGENLSFMNFPVAGSAQTYDATSFAPDSASTATSILTGKKTHSSSINVDITKKQKFRTIAEQLRDQKNWKIGVITSEAMNQEMLENMKVLQMILKLKLSCPENFHCLKGNHENILNEEGRGNHPFYKMAAEGEMFYQFMSEQYDDAVIYILSCLEHALPLCAVFPNLVISHAEPFFELTRSKIINYRKFPEVTLALTWTANGEAKKNSVSESIKNLLGKNCENAVWIGGHRPVKNKYGLRQNGKYVQIHNPDEENIAVVKPDRKFNPETDILRVDVEI